MKIAELFLFRNKESPWLHLVRKDANLTFISLKAHWTYIVSNCSLIKKPIIGKIIPMKCNTEILFQTTLFFLFFGSAWRYMGVSGSGIRSELHLQPKPQLWQGWILNPLQWSGDWACVPALPRPCWSRCATAGTPQTTFYFKYLSYY